MTLLLIMFSCGPDKTNNTIAKVYSHTYILESGKHVDCNIYTTDKEDAVAILLYRQIPSGNGEMGGYTSSTISYTWDDTGTLKIDGVIISTAKKPRLFITNNKGVMEEHHNIDEFVNIINMKNLTNHDDKFNEYWVSNFESTNKK